MNLADKEIGNIEVCVMKLARKSLAGLACIKIHDQRKEDIDYRGKLNSEVRKILKSGTIRTELHIARLRFWQNIVRDPANHRQFLTVFFGNYIWSSTNDWQHHSRFKLLVEDLNSLKEFHSVYDEIFEMYDEFGNADPLKLFTDKIVQDASGKDLQTSSLFFI